MATAVSRWGRSRLTAPVGRERRECRAVCDRATGICAGLGVAGKERDGGTSLSGLELARDRPRAFDTDLAARNLLGNAITHTRSIVTIRTVRTLSGAQLIVDDDGPGIPASDRERVFERFVRLRDDRGRDSGGTGLGPAIVAEIVAAHRGTVTIEDSPYGGARVLLKLPV